MEFDLRDLVSTLMVGAFVLLLVEAVLWFVFARELTGFFRGGRLGWQGGQDYWVPFTVFLAIALPVGIATEDLALQMVTDRPEVISTPAQTVMAAMMFKGDDEARADRPLPRKWILRFAPLMGGDLGAAVDGAAAKGGTGSFAVAPKCRSELRPLPSDPAAPKSEELRPCATPLMRDMARYRVFSHLCGNGFAAWETDILNAQAPWTVDEARYECLQRVYFHARNRVALQDSHNEELERIDLRRRIAAAFALFSTVGMVVLLGCAFASVLYTSVALVHPRDKPKPQPATPPSPKPDSADTSAQPSGSSDNAQREQGPIRAIIDHPVARAALVLATCGVMVALGVLIRPQGVEAAERFEAWAVASLLVALGVLAMVLMLLRKYFPIASAILVGFAVFLTLRSLHLGVEVLSEGWRVFDDNGVLAFVNTSTTLLQTLQGLARTLVPGGMHFPVYAGICLLMATLVFYGCSRKRRRLSLPDTRPWPPMLLSVPTLGVVLVFLVVSSVWIYEFELGEYNKRVMGMYLDLRVTETQAPASPIINQAQVPASPIFEPAPPAAPPVSESLPSTDSLPQLNPFRRLNKPSLKAALANQAAPAARCFGHVPCSPSHTRTRGHSRVPARCTQLPRQHRRRPGRVL